jgi:hypothetical protein
LYFEYKIQYSKYLSILFCETFKKSRNHRRAPVQTPAMGENLLDNHQIMEMVCWPALNEWRELGKERAG